MQQQFGSLKSRTDADLDMGLEVLHEADMAEVERVHQTRLRRLVAALGHTDPSTWVDPKTLGIEPDGAQPGEALDYAVIHGRPVGQGLLPVHQVVYAPAPLDAQPLRYPCPDLVFWVDAGAVVAHGTVTGHRTGNLIVGDEVAIASVDVDMVPWREPVDVGMLMPAFLPMGLDPRAALKVKDRGPAAAAAAVDFHDGLPPHELPAPLQRLQPAQAKALCQVLRTTLTSRACQTE
jgi:hypothetical protein